VLPHTLTPYSKDDQVSSVYGCVFSDDVEVTVVQEARLERCRALKSKVQSPLTRKAEIVHSNREIAALMLGTEVGHFILMCLFGE
jgi:hypothetical protein